MPTGRHGCGMETGPPHARRSTLLFRGKYKSIPNYTFVPIYNSQWYIYIYCCNFTIASTQLYRKFRAWRMVQGLLFGAVFCLLKLQCTIFRHLILLRNDFRYYKKQLKYSQYRFYYSNNYNFLRIFTIIIFALVFLHIAINIFGLFLMFCKSMLYLYYIFFNTKTHNLKKKDKYQTYA